MGREAYAPNIPNAEEAPMFITDPANRSTTFWTGVAIPILAVLFVAAPLAAGGAVVAGVTAIVRHIVYNRRRRAAALAKRKATWGY